MRLNDDDPPPDPAKVAAKRAVEWEQGFAPATVYLLLLGLCEYVSAFVAAFAWYEVGLVVWLGLRLGELALLGRWQRRFFKQLPLEDACSSRELTLLRVTAVGGWLFPVVLSISGFATSLSLLCLAVWLHVALRATARLSPVTRSWRDWRWWRRIVERAWCRVAQGTAAAAFILFWLVPVATQMMFHPRAREFPESLAFEGMWGDGTAGKRAIPWVFAFENPSTRPPMWIRPEEPR